MQQALCVGKIQLMLWIKTYPRDRKWIRKQIHGQVCAASRGEIQGLHDLLPNIKLIDTVMTRKGVGMNMEVAKFVDDSVTYI